MNTLNFKIKQVPIGKTGIYTFKSKIELIDYISSKKSILIAINAEKIINRNPQLEQIINENIGNADGIGAVKALRKKGFKEAIKIPGCELWLDIIKTYEKENWGSGRTVISTTSSGGFGSAQPPCSAH